MLGRGVLWASPIVFFGTDADYARFYDARTLMLIATPVLLVASGVIARQRRWSSAAWVARPRVVCTLIVLLSAPGENAYAFLLFLLLGPFAAIAALVATINGPASR